MLTLLTWLGIYRRNQGDIWGGRRWLQEASLLSPQVADPYREATIQVGLAIGSLDVGQYELALREMEPAITIFAELNDIWHLAWVLIYASLAHYFLNQHDLAAAKAEQSIQLSQQHNLKELTGQSQIVLGFALCAKKQN